MKYLDKTIEYGMYLLVFFLPLQTRWMIKTWSLNGGYSEYETISLYGVDILLIGILALFIWQWFLKKRITNYELRITNLFYILAGLEFFIIISIFFSANKWIAIYSYIEFILGVGLMWLILKASYGKAKLIVSFILGAALQALIGIWQFFSQSDFSSKWLGMAMHKASVLGTSVVETAEGTRVLRAYGGLDHPNILGGLLAVAIILLISQKLNIKSYLNYLFLIILSFGLFVTFSRAAWIGLIMGLAVVLLLAVQKKDLAKQKYILQSILVIGVCLFLLFVKYENLVTTRFSNESRLEEKSNIERLESIDVSEELIKSNFFFGAGIGNYTMRMNRIYVSLPSYAYQPVHNVYLLVLAEIGIFGFLFFVGFLFFLFFNLVKKFKEGSSAVYKLSLLVLICAMFLVDHWWWSLHFGVLLFWFSSGFILREE